MPIQIAKATMERTKERGRSLKTRKDEAEEDINIMETKNRQAMATDCWEWRKTVLEAKVHNGLQCLRRHRIKFLGLALQIFNVKLTLWGQNSM
jgi:hypothetical protein